MLDRVTTATDSSPHLLQDRIGCPSLKGCETQAALGAARQASQAFRPLDLKPARCAVGRQVRTEERSVSDRTKEQDLNTKH